YHRDCSTIQHHKHKKRVNKVAAIPILIDGCSDNVVRGATSRIHNVLVVVVRGDTSR
ncbi:hypothetical protein HAX54_039689, partial [Datura stramonium]|nr:hypothetical protein [Datura stramonium]